MLGDLHLRGAAPAGGDDAVGALAVAQPGPQARPPGGAPARRLVAAPIQTHRDGSGQLGSVADVDLLAGERGVQVRHVPVVRVRRVGVPVLEPFLQLPGRADPIRRQPAAGPVEASGERLVAAGQLQRRDDERRVTVVLSTAGQALKARAGEIRNFTGIDSPYEVPEAAELVLDTDHEPAEAEGVAKA